MTPDPTANDHLPVYESLIRERGDVVTEARVAAEHMQDQAPQGPYSHGWPPRSPVRSEPSAPRPYATPPECAIARPSSP